MSGRGSVLAVFPDLSREPAAPPPVPVPYPNVGPGSRQTASRLGIRSPASPSADSQTLRQMLQTLHIQLIGLPGTDPNRWHALLEEYIVNASALYVTLASR